MGFSDSKRIARRAAVAVAAAGLIAGPAFAFVAMGGGHGFHRGGGVHVVVRPPEPPATVTARAPFVSAPPPMRTANGGFFFHVDDRFHRHDRFGNRRPTIGPRGEGFWGGGYGVYPTGYAEQVYAAEAAPATAAAEVATCPELLTWSPRLGRATRQDLCGDADVRLRSGSLAGG